MIAYGKSPLRAHETSARDVVGGGCNDDPFYGHARARGARDDYGSGGDDGSRDLRTVNASFSFLPATPGTTASPPAQDSATAAAAYSFARHIMDLPVRPSSRNAAAAAVGPYNN